MNAVAIKAKAAATGVVIPPLQTDRVENGAGASAGAQHALLGQQTRSTPREIAEMKQKMAEKDKELEDMKRKMEQTKREAEEEMRRYAAATICSLAKLSTVLTLSWD
jgi:predicted RNase H-like nuclease (RuvC/YqgF family)